MRNEEVEGVTIGVRPVLLGGLAVTVFESQLILSRTLSIASSTFSILQLLLPLPTDVH